MEEVLKAAQTDFEQTSRVAKKEVKFPVSNVSCNIQFNNCRNIRDVFFLPQITRLQNARVEMLQRALVQLCEKQLLTAKENADQFKLQLQAFRGMA